MTLRAVESVPSTNRSDDLELAQALPINSLTLLLRAKQYALNTHRPAWEFAIEIGDLRIAGLTDCDLRWLAAKGFLDHAVEISQWSAGRTFESVTGLHFTGQSTFMLTPSGMRFVESLLKQSDASRRRLAGLPAAERTPPNGHGPLPLWDRQRRELSIGRTVIKRYCVPAGNQEIILSAFQEEAWPAHIDDPLPPIPGMDVKRRLHSTIQCLNRNQKAPLLRFRGDGYGRGVRWERLSA